jgi:hypothetical protein
MPAPNTPRSADQPPAAPKTPPNTPEPPRVNGNVEKREQAEVTPHQTPVVLDNHIPEASEGDWGDLANNAGGH